MYRSHIPLCGNLYGVQYNEDLYFLVNELNLSFREQVDGDIPNRLTIISTPNSNSLDSSKPSISLRRYEREKLSNLQEERDEIANQVNLAVLTTQATQATQATQNNSRKREMEMTQSPIAKKTFQIFPQTKSYCEIVRERFRKKCDYLVSATVTKEDHSQTNPNIHQYNFVNKNKFSIENSKSERIKPVKELVYGNCTSSSFGLSDLQSTIEDLQSSSSIYRKMSFKIITDRKK